MRQYGAQRARGGSNPLRVGTIAVGTIVYLQDQAFFRDCYANQPVCRTPWLLEAFLNGQLHASRRDRDTGLWESAFRSGRSDMAVVRSLRDWRVVRQVSVHTLLVHDDLGLTKGFSGYPTPPDLRFYRQSGMARPARALEQAA